MNNNSKIISNNEELAEVFNKNFSKLLEKLDIDKLWSAIYLSQTLPILFLMLLKSTIIIQVKKKKKKKIKHVMAVKI